MLKKIILSLILIISLSFTSSIHANEEVSSLAKTWFTNYAKKIDKKYSDSKEIAFFQGFSNKLSDLQAKKKFTSAQIKLIDDLTKLANERVFAKKRKNAENSTKIILKTNSLLREFKKFSYNPEHIILENGIWYTYKFDQHLKFPAGTVIKEQDFEFNGIKTDSAIVFRKTDGTLGFVVNYEKIKLISDSIIYGIPDKYNFLKEIKNDKKRISSETDDSFKRMKEKTLELTAKKTKSEKIKTIYNYVLDNVEYTDGFSLSDAKIFSGIDTFTNKDGVCEGYTKLFLYMLNFANINDAEVIRGFVLDAQDFPKVGHAWVSIGNKYYDPTFDDPIGGKETKKYDEYKFYSMPKDLFYTNRYDFLDLPEVLKDKSIEYRKNYIAQKVKSVLEKYKKSGYNFLKPYLLKSNNGINVDDKLNIENLKKITSYHDVNNFSYKYGSQTKTIKTLKYFVINDENAETIAEQLDYSFNGYYLFKWTNTDGSSEYRLGYDVIIQ